MRIVLAGRFGVAGFLAAICLLLLAGSAGSLAGEPNNLSASTVVSAGEPNCVVNLQGKGIVRLVLKQQFGQRSELTFEDPNESIGVAPGTYRLRQIELQGGYTVLMGNLPSRKRQIDLEAGKPASLKFGGPLSQGVKVMRRGKLLRLDYRLEGIGGEQYSDSQRAKAPTFTVYQGDVQIGSGTFAYG